MTLLVGLDSVLDALYTSLSDGHIVEGRMASSSCRADDVHSVALRLMKKHLSRSSAHGQNRWRATQRS